MQQLETPVTYFYTDKPLQANVRIEIPGKASRARLLTKEAPVEKMEPKFAWFGASKMATLALN